MGSLLKWTGIVWAIIGLVGTLYNVFITIPDFSSTLANLASASPYGQLFDPGRFAGS